MLPKECLNKSQCEQEYRELILGEEVFCDVCNTKFLRTFLSSDCRFQLAPENKLWLPSIYTDRNNDI